MNPPNPTFYMPRWKHDWKLRVPLGSHLYYSTYFTDLVQRGTYFGINELFSHLNAIMDLSQSDLRLFRDYPKAREVWLCFIHVAYRY